MHPSVVSAGLALALGAPLPTSGVALVRALVVPPQPGPPEPVPLAPVQGVLDLRTDPPEAPAPPVVSDDARLERVMGRFAQAVVEVASGTRGAFQLLRWTTEEVYLDVVRRAALLGRLGAPQRHRRLRAQVRSVHVSCPARGIAEVSIHVRHGARSRAIAAKLELRDDRWLCSALEWG